MRRRHSGGEMHVFVPNCWKPKTDDGGETDNPFSKERCLFSVGVTKHFKIDLLTFYISRFLPATNVPCSVFNFGFLFFCVLFFLLLFFNFVLVITISPFISIAYCSLRCGFFTYIFLISLTHFEIWLFLLHRIWTLNDGCALCIREPIQRTPLTCSYYYWIA